MNVQTIVTEIADEIARDAAAIEAAADARDEGATPGPFGIAVATGDGVVAAGAADVRFPIQSIAKVLALDLALRAHGDRVFRRVGREPSGDPFINAGALVVVDLLVAAYDSQDMVVDLVRRQVGDDAVALDEDVLNEDGHLNRAMLSFMRHHDNLDAPADRIMDAYGRQCAISVDCRGLALTGRFLTQTHFHHDDPAATERARRMRTVLALMMTCGHYDGSGDFAVRVGLPAKSGVGGGILAIAPERASIAVWSPNLDQHGNSILGVRALEMLAARTGWSVFGAPAA